MRFSFQLILAGVGVFVPFSHAAISMAAPVSAQSQASTQSGKVGQTSVLEQWVNSVDRSAQPSSKLEATRAAKKASLLTGQANSAQGSDRNDVTAQTPPQPATPQTQPTTPPPGSTIPEPEIEPLGKPIGPAKSGAAPDYLNPVPNPLSLPVRPEDVKLQGIQPITLQQALELAERNSPTYQVSALQLQRSQAALRQAQAELYPTFSLQANVTRSESPQSDLANRERNLLGVASQDITNRFFSGTASLNYDLFTSGRRPAQIRAAEQQVRFDQLQVEVTRAQLRLDVTNAYYDLQSADADVRIGQAAVRNAQISLRDAQAQERAGIGTRFDVLRAQVQLGNSQQQLVNAISQQQINRRQLARRLNISPEIDLAAADPIEAAGQWTLPLEDSIVLAFRNRAELEQFLAQREQAKQNRKAALASLGPTLSVTAQYQLQDSFQDSFGPGFGYVLQAGLRWTLLDGGAARASAAQAEANLAIAETNFSNQRNQIRFDVEQAYAQLLSNRENIGTAELALTSAREALRLARLRFQAGVGTQTEVINAETDLTNSQGNLVDAILRYNRALAALQRAITNLPIPTGQTSPPLAPSTPSSTTPPASGANFQTSPVLNTIPSPAGTPATTPGSGTTP